MSKQHQIALEIVLYRDFIEEYFVQENSSYYKIRDNLHAIGNKEDCDFSDPRTLIKNIDQESKKQILDEISDPDFTAYFYIPRDHFNEAIQALLRPEPYYKFLKESTDIGIEQVYVNEVKVDNNWRRIYGTKSNPYVLAEIDEFKGTYKNHLGIVPFVCYHHDGTANQDAIEYIISLLPEDASENSVVLVYQWKNEDPIKNGLDFSRKVVRLSTLIGKLSH